MKVLHVSYLRDPSACPGILNQLRYERLAAKSSAIDLQNVMFSKDGVFDLNNPENRHPAKAPGTPNIASWLTERMAFANFLEESSVSYDVILVRWSVADPFAARAIRKLSKPVFTVHHTNEEAELRSNARLGALRARLDRALFGMVSSSLSGIIAVTPEIGQFERVRGRSDLPVISYPNGIIVGGINVSGTIGASGVTRLVFVASHFSNWHGLDLLFESVRRSSEKFELHIVGEVSEAQRSAAQGDERVFLRGLLSIEELYSLYKECDIGLSSFALHRKSLQQASTLKVREYLSAGIPVYSGHEDIFPSDFKYFRKGPPEIKEILRYSDELRGVPRQMVRETAAHYIDKSAILKNLYNEIVSIIAHGDFRREL